MAVFLYIRTIKAFISARLYDPLTARWNGVDALAEKYHSTTGYGYVLGNPVNAVDLDGREVYYTRSGKRLGKIGSSTQVVLIDDMYAPWVMAKATEIAECYAVDAQQILAEQLNLCGSYLGMTEEELNVRAFMTALRDAENHGNGLLPYNIKHGRKNGKLLLLYILYFS